MGCELSSQSWQIGLMKWLQVCCDKVQMTALREPRAKYSMEEMHGSCCVTLGPVHASNEGPHETGHVSVITNVLLSLSRHHALLL